MDTSRLTFVRGPKEHSGAVDLISQYKLYPHHELFCKKTPSVSILDTNYLRNVVGDTDIRKGEGMQLDQLVQNTPSRDKIERIQPFKLDVLGEAFHLRESASVNLDPSDKGIPTVAVKSKSDSKHKDKHGKRKHKDGVKDKDRSKHKRRGEKDKEKKKDKKKKRDGGENITGDGQNQKKTMKLKC